MSSPGPAVDDRDGESQADHDRAPEPATIEVTITCEAPNEIQTLAISAQFDGDDGFDQGAMYASDPQSTITCRLEVPALKWLNVEVRTDKVLSLTRRLRLAPRELHRITATCPPRIASLQIAGPSPQLFEHLELEVLDRGAPEPEPQPMRVGFGGHGSAAMRIFGPAIASFRTTHGDLVPALTKAGEREFWPGPATIELTPQTDLTGIFVEAKGHRVAAVVSPAQQCPPVQEQTKPSWCTICRREVAESATGFVIAVESWQLLAPPSAARRVADRWTFSTHELARLGELRVRFQATGAGPTVDPTPLHAVSLADDSRHPLTKLMAEDDLVAFPPVGEYRLVWAKAPGDDATLLDFVRIQPIVPTVLELNAPEGQPWRIHLPDAPPGVQLALEWPSSRHLGASATGEFEVELGQAPDVGDRAALMLRRQPREFAAEFTAVDRTQRRATLASPVTRAQRVPLRVEALAPAGVADLRIHNRQLGEPHVWLLPGETLRLHATEIVDDQRQMLGWFEVAPGQQEVTLRPRGRWATMRFERDRGSARVFHVGPDSETVELKLRPTTTPFRFFVADGTTAIHVEVDGVRQTFGTNLAEFVVR